MRFIAGKPRVCSRPLSEQTAALVYTQYSRAYLPARLHDAPVLRLPGVSVSNYRDIMRRVDCVADLAHMSVEDLTGCMGGVIGARKLHAFFREQGNL